jgi:hypothetical protein
MRVPWLAGLLGIAAALSIALTGAAKMSGNERQAGQEKQATQERLPLHEKSTSANDLQLSGNLPGAPANAVRFVSYTDLLALPQVTFTVTDDSNFSGKVEISGIYLDELLKVLDIPEKTTLIAAICDDEYEGHYPVEYRVAHHPILVLRLNGQPLAQSKRSADGGVYGPYLVSHESFKPRYHILAHAEESQIPNGVLEIRFLSEDDALGAIRPRGNFAAGSPQLEGYEIAEQNCFRCHNAGPYGGRKSGISWLALAKLASEHPAYFSAYIKNPQEESAYAEMPGFPEYDNATLAVLTAYFLTFAPERGSK